MPAVDPSRGPHVVGQHAPRLARSRLKRLLTVLAGSSPAEGATFLIYHRVGAGTGDELDVPATAFARQLEQLDSHEVLSIDAALDRLDAKDPRPCVVLTFDDGFEDVYDNAWPLLRERQLPFTVYLASSYVSTPMVWEGSTAKGAAGRGVSWDHLAEMVESGLCTVGNHTHRHVPPDSLSASELDECTAVIESRLGVTPSHFTYPWGVAVPTMERALEQRFRSASTGRIGRNTPDTHRLRLARVPVRQSDPDEFFAAKLTGRLLPERAYARLVAAAKAAGMTG